MSYCSNCGAPVSGGAFCSSCGAALEQNSKNQAVSGNPEIQAGSNLGSNAYLHPPKTNVLAIISLVGSLLGISLAGIICGHIALSQIKRSNEAGRGMALAGTIIGYVTAVVFALALTLYVIGLIAAIRSGDTSGWT